MRPVGRDGIGDGPHLLGGFVGGVKDAAALVTAEHAHVQVREIAIAADIRICTTRASFAQPEIALGIITGGLSATSGGIAAAVVFGLLMAILCRPKEKR